MRAFWLALAMPMVASAGIAQAEGKPGARPPLLLFQPIAIETQQRANNLSIIQQGPAQRSNGGFIASLAISDRAKIGVGRFYFPTRRRLGAHDQPISLQTKKTRRAAIGLSLSF